MDYAGEKIGLYNIIENIGSGSFGSVYRASNEALNNESAIKILEVDNPDEIYALYSEAGIPHNCAHNNIIQVNSATVETHNSKSLFIIDMEIANQGSVEKQLGDTWISVKNCIEIIKQVLFGLQHAHNNNTIHHDIKPANILLHNGIPKISDFGLATSIENPNAELRWYFTHMAPKVVEGGIPTVQTDIYALGMTFYRIINNIANWQDFISDINNLDDKIKKGLIIKEKKYEPYVPSKCYRIISKACNPDPTKRYCSASEMRNALERINFNIDWIKIDENRWQGFDSTQNEFELSLEITPRKTKVNFKRNNRRVVSDCRSFTNYKDAQKYLLEYISNSTIN